jgi:transcriptional regulator with XRE-family HTH domain
MQLIGAALRRRRQRLGWSQRDLGRRTGVDQSTISRLETGVRCGLRWSRFAAVVAVLGGLDFDTTSEPARADAMMSFRMTRAQLLAEDEARFQAAVAAIQAEADAEWINDAEAWASIRRPFDPGPDAAHA